MDKNKNVDFTIGNEDFTIGIKITLSDTADNLVATFNSSYLTDKTISLIMRDVGNYLSNDLIGKLNNM